jgi:hypothetical protein
MLHVTVAVRSAFARLVHPVAIRICYHPIERFGAMRRPWRLEDGMTAQERSMSGRASRRAIFNHV